MLPVISPRKAFDMLQNGEARLVDVRETSEYAETFIPGARLVPLEAPVGVPLLPSMEGTLCVEPDGLFEGFFVAKLFKP